MAARKSKAKAKTKAKTKARPKGKAAASRGSSKAKKTAFKRPILKQEAKAPLAEMDAAWQSLLETAIERHRDEDAEGAAKPKATKK